MQDSSLWEPATRAVLLCVINVSHGSAKLTHSRDPTSSKQALPKSLTDESVSSNAALPLLSQTQTFHWFAFEVKIRCVMRSIAFPLRGRWLSETKPDEVFCSTSSVTVVSEADFTVTVSPQGEAFGRRLVLLAGCHSEGASAPVRIRNNP